MNIRIPLAIFLVSVSLHAWSANEKWSALQNELAAMADESHVPAMGLVIMDNHQPAVVRTWGDGITTATPFRWGSISKTFTALGLLRLVELGEVELSDPLRNHLPRGIYQNPWADKHPILLHHLVELTAGFSDLSGSEFSQNQPLSLSRALALNPTSRTTRWPPGLQHNYSNLTPGLTSVVIEQVSGRDFESFMAEQVLQRLGMREASFQPLTDLPGGFKADGLTEIPYWHMSFRAFGALNASIDEMSNFLTVLLNNGSLYGVPILPPKTIAAMFHPQTSLGVTAGLDVAYGAGVYGWVREGHVFQGHGGDADGYRSRYGLLADSGRGYLIVINTDNPQLLRALQKRIERELIIDLAEPAKHPAATESSTQLEQFTGTYYPAAARFGVSRWTSGELTTARVSLQGEELSFTRGRRKVSLINLGEGRFRREDDPVTTVVFVQDEQGAMFIQGELGNFAKIDGTACPGFLAVCNSQ